MVVLLSSILSSIRSGRTLVPVKNYCRRFWFTVTWNGSERTVTITKPDNDNEIIIYLDEGTVYVNGEEVEIDVPGSIMNGRTYVPLRFILETFGLSIEWDPDAEIIVVN